MKSIYTLISVLTFSFAQAQIADRTEINCDGESRSIYETLSNGTPIIVASKGFDCSICMNSADNVAEFADNNLGSVEVWGAMAYRYSSAIPDCEAVNTWDATYSWDNIFSFPDVEEFWFGTGFPTYTVLDPSTQDIAYSGGSFSTATNTALSLITLSTEEIIESSSFSVFADGDNVSLRFNAKLAADLNIEIFNITGQSIGTWRVKGVNGLNLIKLPFNARNGVYIVNLSTSNLSISKKFFVLKN